MSHTEQEWMNQLSREGFSNLLFCDAIPHTTEDDHAHDRDHKLAIFSGDMEIKMEYQTVHLGSHDYFEIPSGTVHAMIVGADGCRYLIAERM